MHKIRDRVCRTRGGRSSQPSLDPRTTPTRSLVLLTGHAARRETSAGTAHRRARREQESDDSTKSEPVGVSELGLVVVALETVLKDVPENHVDDENDETDNGAEDGEETHEDGREAGRGTDGNQAHDHGEESESASNRVQDKCAREIVQDLRVEDNAATALTDCPCTG